MHLDRLPRRLDVTRVPTPLGDGLFRVDATWGTVQPIQLDPGVRTIGELELVELAGEGAQLVDTREPDAYAQRTIPGARNMPHERIAERAHELDRDTPVVLFCNGPQCLATPKAVRALLATGFPASCMRYYRGGLHDWMTLGYPTVAGR